MTASVAPRPRLVPVERVLSVTGSGGAHSNGAGSYRTVMRYEVWTETERVADCESKREAESFIEGWESHRNSIRSVLEAL